MRLLGITLALLVASTAAAHEAWGIVSDGQTIYFADVFTNTIWSLRGGKVTPTLRDIHSHALSMHDGVLYGSHAHMTRPIRGVWKLDRGQFAYLVGPDDIPLGCQSFLRAVDGTMYSASLTFTALLQRNVDGSIATIANGFSQIDGIAEHPDGSLILADGPAVKRVLPDGTVQTIAQVSRKSDLNEDLLGIAARENGAIVVADTGGRQIVEIRPDGTIAPLTGRGWLWTPAGVWLEGQSLVTLEHLRMPLTIVAHFEIGPYIRVRRDGRTVATVWGRHSWVLAVLAVLVAALGAVLVRRRYTRASRT